MANNQPFYNQRNLSQRFVPWNDGVNISANQNGANTGGYTWFRYDRFNFGNINTSGRYIIENNCDAYLFFGDTIIGSNGPIITNPNGVIVPPFSAGVYQLNTDTPICTAMCAGYDFSSVRKWPSLQGNSGGGSTFLFTRGPTAYVRLTSIGSDDNPSVLPSLRTGFTRTYDFYDICKALGVSTSTGPAVSHGTAILLLAGLDSQGVKSITFGAMMKNGTDTGNIYLTGRDPFFLDEYVFATQPFVAPTAGINATTNAIATAATAPPASFSFHASNTNAAVDSNIVDAFVSLGF